MEPHETPDVTAPPSDRDRRSVVLWCIAAIVLLPTPIWLGDLLGLETGWRFGVAILLGVVLGRLCPVKAAARWLEHARHGRG